MLGWMSRNKKGKTTLGTQKKKQKNDKMRTITGTLTIELAWNKQKKNYESRACTKNIRTIMKYII